MSAPQEGSSYVYVLTNPAMPGLVKIGRTDAADPEDRAKQLYTTGVPVPFDVEYAGVVADPTSVESALHTAFEDKRVNPRREFFRIEVHQVVAILELFDSQDVTSTVAAELQSEVSPAERRAGDLLRSRRPPLNFEEMGMPVGSPLVFTRDESIIVTVSEPKKVDVDGEPMALSAATRDLLGVDYYVAPTKFWMFEGRSLTDIYEETYPPAGT